MNEFPNAERAPIDEYGWSSEELKMPLLYQGYYLDFFPDEENGRRAVKSSARWDGHNYQVIVRAVDGFMYRINDIRHQPDLNGAQEIHEVAKEMWRSWYLEQVNKPGNVPGSDTTIQ